MRGEIVSFQLIDLGGTVDVSALQQSLRDRKRGVRPGVGKGTPGYVEFPEPITFELAPLRTTGPLGTLEARVSIEYFPIGAASVRFRVPIEVKKLSELREWSRTQVQWLGETVSLEAAARRLVEQDRPQWDLALRDRYPSKMLHEIYTVFAFTQVDEEPDTFLQRHSEEVAGLLKGEDGTKLHAKEVKEALREWFSYYKDDVIVVDWDAALIVDRSPEYEDLLFVLEIANLQLLQFRSYDDYLDDAIARGYDDLGRMYRRGGLLNRARKTAHDLSLLRMEVAELADEADNITKFLGDWFLARVYEAANEKFHLPQWRATVDEKLSVLNTQYQLANAEQDSRRMLVLEALIVLLFVIDLAGLFVLKLV